MIDWRSVNERNWVESEWNGWPSGFTFTELVAFTLWALSVARESAVNGQIGHSGQRFAAGQEPAGAADGRTEVTFAVGIAVVQRVVEEFFGLEAAFEDDDRRRFLFGSRRRRRHGAGRAPPLPRRQHQAARDRHDDHHVVQAHSCHVHQVDGQDFIAHLYPITKPIYIILSSFF